MLSCKQAVNLVSNDIDKPLKWPQRLRLNFHLLICRLCRNYARHIHFIHRTSGQIDTYIENIELSLSNEQRDNLKRSIDNKK